MSQKEIEDLFLRSLDQPLSESEMEKLASALRDNSGIANDVSHYTNLRETMLRKEPATFGPYFAQKVIARIQSVKEELDNYIVFFFKKYQIAALGVMIALLTVNVVFSDQFDITSIFDVQDTSVINSPDDEIQTFNFLENLASE
ncbi:hypothetical protein BH10BAC4_BH10BAC4_09810 [soil metagenome]